VAENNSGRGPTSHRGCCRSGPGQRAGRTDSVRDVVVRLPATVADQAAGN